MFAIDWMPRARKQLAKLGDRVAQLRLLEAVGDLASFPQVPGLEALRNHRFSHRLRVGSYRVLVHVDTEHRCVAIHEIRKRNERTY
ncbi:MAG: type II toxin-antitoxin system RelE/ParE family toxin [Thermoanaerobaculia bacterium]